MKDINIVFLNFFMKEDILQAIDSLVQDIVECPYSVQITVADNSNNGDGIEQDLASRFPSVHYVNSGGNVGFGKGNVVGFKTCEARYYFALNRDTVIPPNAKTVERLVRFMDEHPKIACIGPKLLNMDGSLQYNCYRFDLPSLLIKPLKQIQFDKKYKWIKKHADRLEMKDFDHNSTRPVDWVLGAAMVVRREVIERIGWFDERYFMYLEDCDWCRTMWDHHFPVYYVHDIVIYHRHERASSKVPGIWKALFKNKLARIHAKSWLQYLWKWKGKRYFTI